MVYLALILLQYSVYYNYKDPSELIVISYIYRIIIIQLSTVDSTLPKRLAILSTIYLFGKMMSRRQNPIPTLWSGCSPETPAIYRCFPIRNSMRHWSCTRT
jgi:hypothetical protein